MTRHIGLGSILVSASAGLILGAAGMKAWNGPQAGRALSPAVEGLQPDAVAPTATGDSASEEAKPLQEGGPPADRDADSRPADPAAAESPTAAGLKQSDEIAPLLSELSVVVASLTERVAGLERRWQNAVEPISPDRVAKMLDEALDEFRSTMERRVDEAVRGAVVASPNSGPRRVDDQFRDIKQLTDQIKRDLEDQGARLDGMDRALTEVQRELDDLRRKVK